MKVRDIITESYVAPGIRDILDAKGYKYLGHGADQYAYEEPGTGLVLKIFGTSNYIRASNTSGTDLSNAQKSFKTFYDAIQADPDNEFLPNIMGYEKFMFNRRPYLQIRMEKLFPFKGKYVRVWNKVLADITRKYVKKGKFKNGKEFVDALDKGVDGGNMYISQLMMHLGKDGLEKLYDTIVLLNGIANKNGYTLDLHSGNFMLGSDGTPVISDPFYMGWTTSQ